MADIETLFFRTTADLVKWMSHAMKMDRYNVVATSVTTIFGDGHTTEHEIKRNAKQNGTIASNYSFMIRTLTGKMEHTGDNALAEEIDRRGGVRFIYHVA